MHLGCALYDRVSSRSSEVVCVVMPCRAVSGMGTTEKEQQLINRRSGSSIPALMAASRSRLMIQFGSGSSQDDQNDGKRSLQDAKVTSGTC